MSTIFQDIDDALHQERLAALWQAWRWPLLVGLSIALLVLVGRAFWHDYQARTYAQALLDYQKALQTTDQTALTALMASSDPTVRNLARWTVAQTTATTPEAVQAALTAIRDDWRAPQLLQDLAQLQLAVSTLASADSATALQDLVDDAGALAPLAAEFMGLQAENKADATAAQTAYAQALTLAVTPAQRERVQANLNRLQQQQGQ